MRWFVGVMGQALAWVAWVEWVCKVFTWVKKMTWVVWVDIFAWVAWLHKILARVKKRHGWCGSKLWRGWPGSIKCWRGSRGSIKLAWVEVLAEVKKTARCQNKMERVKINFLQVFMISMSCCLSNSAEITVSYVDYQASQ